MSLDLGTNGIGEIVARMIVERDISTFAGEDLANCGADATRPSRHKRTFSFK